MSSQNKAAINKLETHYLIKFEYQKGIKKTYLLKQEKITQGDLKQAISSNLKISANSFDVCELKQGRKAYFLPSGDIKDMLQRECKFYVKLRNRIPQVNKTQISHSSVHNVNSSNSNKSDIKKDDKQKLQKSKSLKTLCQTAQTPKIPIGKIEVEEHSLYTVDHQKPPMSPQKQKQQNLSVQPTKNQDISKNLAKLFEQYLLQKKHQVSLILSGRKLSNKKSKFDLQCNLCSASPISQIFYACQINLSFISCTNCIRYQQYQLPFLKFISFTDLETYNDSLQNNNPKESLTNFNQTIRQQHQKRNTKLKKILNDIPFPEFKINA